MIVINARFLTQRMTGVQRYAFEVCSRLPKKIGNKKLIFIAPNETIINKLNNDIDIVFVGKFKGQLWEQISLPAFLKKNKNPMLINFVGIAPIFYKNKIMFLYDLAFKHHPEWFSYSFQKLYNFLIPVSLKNSKRIITDSNYVKQDIVKTYKIPNSKINVIYAAPSNKFINKNLKREKFILTVSSIDPRKNLERVIKAFNKIESEYKLVIVGKKSKTFSNVELNEKIINDNIIFTGYLTDDELIDIYNKAELFIYASLFEGFGIPPLEAQACGCACIISNVTSLPEVYEDSVEYFDPRSTDSIKIKMEEMINNKDKMMKLRNLGVINLKRYNWGDSTSKLKSIIEELI
ncbi:glycosyltransferase family 4 protein [Sabulilitoribacter arenilitoris]|uniref:Glycosyltransferase family 4 protein n=1 Tax=Wocania arenilitoris TaxID=2044858 RepID=A0AAE3ELT3_9FLAO|nr:glycosyltransferase family 1 protein [Wocania arenilitoris]MCF7566777.1 glycosyltransferase family 4 protein [Wocania arenilitoris]